MRGPVLFADESGVRERHLVFGAVFVPSDRLTSVESTLETFCQTKGFPNREVSWKKCSKGETARYAEFADLLWPLFEQHEVEFRALAVDTVLNPLKHDASGATSAELGFYKFYHLFITRSVKLVAPNARNVTLNVADLDDQYPFRSEVLTKTVSGKLRELLPSGFEVVRLERGTPRESRIHQLTDVLAGAVAYRLNGRSSHKEAICVAIEKRIGKRLDRDSFPVERPFNLWGFAAHGQRRWTRGSKGTA